LLGSRPARDSYQPCDRPALRINQKFLPPFFIFLGTF
jgi:hypothetical protein